MDYSQDKLGRNAQTQLLRHMEGKDKGQVKRAWNDEDQDMQNTPYFWKCPKQLLPSRVLKFYLPGYNFKTSNRNALYINSAAQGLIWYLLLTSGNSGQLVKILAPLSALELAIHLQQQ